MKKLLAILLCATILATFAACGNQPNSSAESSQPADFASSTSSTVEESSEISEVSSEESNPLNDLGEVSVEQNIFDVKITIPADFVEEGTTQASLDEEAEKAGYQSAVLNDDGTVTYVMTKKQHEEMMDAIKAELDNSLKEMIDSGTYSSFQDVTVNDDYTEFVVQVSSSELGIEESIAVIGFYMFSGIYHAFNGTQPDDVVVKYVNADTGELINESHSNEVTSE